MKKIVSILLAAGLLLSLIACGAQPPAPVLPASQTGESVPKPSETLPSPGAVKKVQAADLLEGFAPQSVEEKKADEAFIENGYRWAVSLFRKIYTEEKENKTLLISPLSVMVALAMTQNGAEGETLQEMESLLGGGKLDRKALNAYLHTYLNSLPRSEKAKFSFANSIWFKDQTGFVVEDTFLQTNVNYYEAAIRKEPFDQNTLRDINQWVDQHTDHMIPKLLEELDEETRMLLINALVFDAKWEVPFPDYGKNQKGPFINLQGEEEEAEYLGSMEYSYLENEELIGFTKAYEGDTYRFVALLPKEPSAFESVIHNLDGKKLAKLLAEEQERNTEVIVPKFSFDYDTNLKDVLMGMGMQQAFDSQKADLGGISRSESLYIGGVIHKTHIDLDAEGTRAAAVTAVAVYGAGIMEPLKEVILNRPFMYMIIDTATHLPIFMGTVTGFEE